MTAVVAVHVPRRAVLDVVFVHGLDGDARASWRCGGDGTFWPRWLAADLAGVAVWTLGYDAWSSGWRGQSMPVPDRAVNLMAQLQNAGLGERPLCFVTHSMGGLLVKEILLHAAESRTDFACFAAAARGVVFLGTPHTGSGLTRAVDALGVLYRGTPAVEDLRRNSAYLRQLNDRYRDWADETGIANLVFFETRLTRRVRVVDEASANPGLPRVRPIPVDADHVGICKPADRASLVYGQVKRFVLGLLPGRGNGQAPPAAVHRTILVADVEGFSDRSRTNRNQLSVRDTMYQTLRRAFRKAGIPWEACYHEDRGDGVLVLAPPEVPKAAFAEALPSAIVETLEVHNRVADAGEEIRLRLAVHGGEVHYDQHGVTSNAVVLAFRLVESAALKSVLAGSSSVLAMMVSPWFFDEVVRHSQGSRAETWRPFPVSLKGSETTGWTSLPGDPWPAGEPPAVAEPADQPVPHSSPRADREDGCVQLAKRTLPRDAPAFTGRTAELENVLKEITDAVHPGCMVAIHAIDGMAGVGKTALAVHAGHLLAERFPDGQLFLRLHGHTPGERPVGPADALASLLTMIGVTVRQMPAGLDARAALWRDRLADKQVLLILDDALSHQQVEPLLPAAAGALVIITSRRRLTALDGAVSVALDVLPAEEASALFVRLSGRSVRPEESEAVERVVRLCGWLPLAVTLLAGRLRSRPQWTVKDLADELDSTHDRLGRLRAEDIEVAAAFDLSYRELGPGQQRFFRRIGLHPGPELDAHATAAMADLPVAEAGAHLGALYDDHMLEEPAFDRYRMHDLIREYSRNLSNADDPQETERAVCRLFDYYCDTAADAAAHIAKDVTTDGLRETRSPRRRTARGTRVGSSIEAWRWMRVEAVNLLACADHAIRHGWHHHVVDLSACLAKFLYVAGPWDRALRLHQSAVRAAEHNGDEAARAHALNHLGGVQRRIGDYTSAATSHAAALESYTALRDEAGQAAALGQLGAVRRCLDDYPGAAEAFQRALAMLLKLGDRSGEAHARNELGILYLVSGDYRAAVGSHEHALSIYEELDDLLGQADAWNELGVARRAIGDLPGAVDANTRAVGGFRRLGDGFHESFALNSLAVAWRMIGEPRKAVDAHHEALAISRSLGDRLGEGFGLNELGAALRLVGELEAADQCHAEALDIFTELGNQLGKAETLNHMGALLLATGQVGEAGARYRSALPLAREVNSPLEEAQALAGLGRCAVSRGDQDGARECLRAALEIFERIGSSEAEPVRDFLRLDLNPS
ncbi:tetratricopeptide repeat protein [Amycolatopsis sp. FU40]|uniref:tetratricopeptide repeat protein n=1 Tax=Amycolatopsis sp. FU40 TaxID=2914159 RepID=UPI001F32FB58|nr:tetratricopeptide repeat protein [Amycolatopsis sp. FU40]UKD54661.1 tetratricopeptide repeat protein [Amycolatopsis sp. FU40]